MQRFCNSWCIRNQLVIVERLNQSLELGEYIVSLHRHWTTYTQRLVLAMSPGNPPAVRGRTGKTVLFGSRTVQKQDPKCLGGPNPDSYPSTLGFCRVGQDLSVSISGSVFRVFLFMVAYKYPTVNRKILTFAHH
jgi:hypothetical protein